MITLNYAKTKHTLFKSLHTLTKQIQFSQFFIPIKFKRPSGMSQNTLNRLFKIIPPVIPKCGHWRTPETIGFIQLCPWC